MAEKGMCMNKRIFQACSIKSEKEGGRGMREQYLGCRMLSSHIQEDDVVGVDMEK